LFTKLGNLEGCIEAEMWRRDLESYSIWHWILLLIVFGVFAYPAVRILRRAGLSGWWVLMLLVPVANVVGLWLFAFARWPAVDSRQ
jgi:uncharacterized membrane protein YhaH (DUF805 family)